MDDPDVEGNSAVAPSREQRKSTEPTGSIFRITAARDVESELFRGDDRPVPPTFRFELPGALQEVRLLVDLSAATDARQHVLLLEVARPAEVSLEASGLSWSDRLGARFQYVPAAAAPGTVSTPGFSVPGAARALQIRVHSWREDLPPVVTRIRMNAVMEGHSVSILPEEA